MGKLINYRGSNMSVHVLIIPTQCFYRFYSDLIGPLVKLNGFCKRDGKKSSILSPFATSLINQYYRSTNVRFYLSYSTKTTF